MAQVEVPFSRRLLVAIDGSENSKLTMEYAIKNVIRDSDYIVVLFSTLELGTLFETWRVDASIQQELMKHAHQLPKNIQDVIRPLQDVKDIFVDPRVVEASPKDAIMEIATKEHCAMIIVGSRSAGALKRTFVGTLADHLVHHSKVPVLVIQHEERGGRGSMEGSRRSSADHGRRSLDGKH